MTEKDRKVIFTFQNTLSTRFYGLCPDSAGESTSAIRTNWLPNNLLSIATNLPFQLYLKQTFIFVKLFQFAKRYHCSGTKLFLPTGKKSAENGLVFVYG